MAEHTESTFRLVRVEVEGFKCFRQKQKVEIAPITILCGTNSAGKSSAIHPLLMIKQTINSDFETPVLRLDGPNITCRQAETLFWAGPPRNESFTIGLYFEFTDKENHQKFKTARRIYFSKSDHEPLRARKQDLEFDGKSLIIDPSDKHLSPDHLRDILSAFGVSYAPATQEWASREDQIRKRLHTSLFHIRALGDVFGWTEDVGFPISHVLEYNGDMMNLRDMVHIPALRMANKLYHHDAISSRANIGKFDNYVANIIHIIQNESGEKYNTLISNAKKLGLADKIQAQKVDDTRLELLVSRALSGVGARDMINIADVGTGVSQALPLLVALAEQVENRIVYIEQPELHLHPKAQVGLAQILAEYVKAGGDKSTLILETHSSHLLLGLQTAVARGDLDPQHVKLHWFNRNPETGESTITIAEMNDRGEWGEWPQDFDDTIMAAQQAFLDAHDAAVLRGRK